MSRKSSHNQQGFTLIELMLAMAFVAFVLLFMVLTIVQMVRTYDKGLTIKQINQAGRTITEDISKTMRGEQPGKIVLTNVPNGRLCIGNVMYVWNPVYLGTPTSPTPNQVENYRLGGTPLSMARQYLTDPTTTCNAATLTNYNIAPSSTNYSLLGNRARVMRAGVTPSADGRLVELTFVLGTYSTTEVTAIRQNRIDDVFNTPHFASGQPTCHPGANGNYCAFAEFSTTVYLPNGQ